MFETDYAQINGMLESIIEGVPYTMTNLANASALLFEKVEGINWAGFYTVKDGKLVLGPFQGKVACTIIPMGKGVCGTAAAEDRTVVVPDVHKGELFGVLDIDSPLFDRFGEDDRLGLEDFVRILEKEI